MAANLEFGKMRARIRWIPSTVDVVDVDENSG